MYLKAGTPVLAGMQRASLLAECCFGVARAACPDLRLALVVRRVHFHPYSRGRYLSHHFHQGFSEDYEGD